MRRKVRTEPSIIMADPISSLQNQCWKCSAVPEAGSTFKVCARCRKASYCSRDCQKADWKEHKKNDCADIARPKASPLSFNVEKPFHKLHDKTWLHDRPQEDVYKLLIDAFRLRLNDDHDFQATVDATADGGCDGFRFLTLVTSNPELLPTWWTAENENESVKFGMAEESWSNLDNTIEKTDLVDHYGDPLMHMQLRMFAEQVYGTGPGCHSGGPMLQAQMAVERGELKMSIVNFGH